VIRRARDAQQNREVQIRSQGPAEIERGTSMRVRIQIANMDVADPHGTILWVGEISNTTFPVAVPPDAAPGAHLGTATVYIGPCHVSKLSFEISVGATERDTGDMTCDERRIKSAFASYASEERAAVLGRVQGMLKILPELDIFVDVLSLRSGDKWEERIAEAIGQKDVFYLFWSRAASRSPWVEQEWRSALASRGLDFIDPVPLEPPHQAPPPPELASLHFNEWTLAYWQSDAANLPGRNETGAGVET
jgi:hypothetical protein